jgi:hypothetical protein
MFDEFRDRLREYREARRSPGDVEVYGELVPIPSAFQRAGFAGFDLGDLVVENAAEHEAGCHGSDCDGRCAERTYARWSEVPLP